MTAAFLVWLAISTAAAMGIAGYFGLAGRWLGCLWGHLHTLAAAWLLSPIVAATAKNGEPHRLLRWATTCDTDEFTDPATGQRVRRPVNLYGDEDWLHRHGPEGVKTRAAMGQWVRRNAAQWCAYRLWGVDMTGLVECIVAHPNFGDRYRLDLYFDEDDVVILNARGAQPEDGAEAHGWWFVGIYRVWRWQFDAQLGWKRRAHYPEIDGRRWAKISFSPMRRHKP